MTKTTLLSQDLQRFCEECPKDDEGWIKKSCLLKKIQTSLSCSYPTTYAQIKKYLGMFEMKHGKIRVVGVTEYKDPKEEYVKWFKEKNEFLDKVVEFLGTLPPNPKKEDLLVKVGTTREELTSGVDDGIEEIKRILEQDFNIKEGSDAESESLSKTQVETTENFPKIFPKMEKIL